jgi:hypothetical protein
MRSHRQPHHGPGSRRGLTNTTQLKYAHYRADEFFTEVEKAIFGLGYYQY